MTRINASAPWQTSRAWRSPGATHLSVDTIGAGLTSVDAHIDALRRIKEVLDT